jgi:hypothetical protein
MILPFKKVAFHLTILTIAARNSTDNFGQTSTTWLRSESEKQALHKLASCSAENPRF